MTLIRKITFSPLTLILVLYLVIFSIINPFAEVAVNDEWAHSRQVEAFLNNSWRIQANTDATLILLAFSGYIWSLIFGYSLVNLKIMIFIYSLVLLVFAYKSFKIFNISYLPTFIGLSCLFFNPLTLHLSGVFMTDIPFLSLFSVSLFFYLKELKSSNKIYSILGTLFIGLSFLIRQSGFVIFSAWVLYKLISNLKNKESLMFLIKKVFLEILILSGFFCIYLFWPRYGGSQVLHIISNFNDPSKIGDKLLFALNSFFYLSFFLIPIAIFARTNIRKLFFPLCAVIMVLVTYFLYKNNVFPTGNILYLEGLYAKSSHFFQINLVNNLFVKVIFSVLISLSFIKISTIYLSNIKLIKSSKELALLSFIWVLLLIVLIVPNDAYDRYLLPLFYVTLISLIILLEKTDCFKFSFLRVLTVLTITFINILLVYEFTTNNKIRWEAAKIIRQETGVKSKIYVNGTYSRYATAQKIKDYSGNTYIDANAQYICVAETKYFETGKPNKIKMFVDNSYTAIASYFGKPNELKVKIGTNLGIPRAREHNKIVYYKQTYLSPLNNILGYSVEVEGWCDKNLLGSND